MCVCVCVCVCVLSEGRGQRRFDMSDAMLHNLIANMLQSLIA